MHSYCNAAPAVLNMHTMVLLTVLWDISVKHFYCWGKMHLMIIL